MDSSKPRHIQKNNPITTANILSRTFFCWTVPLFIKGYRKDLEEEDLYPTLPYLKSKKLGDQIERIWNKEKEKTKKNPKLWRVLTKMLYWEILIFGLEIAIVKIFLKLSQPFLLGRVLAFFKADQNDMTIKEAYIYASLLLGSILGESLITNHYFLRILEARIKLGIACSAFIYRKTLKLSKSSMAETTVGQLINLLSNDIRRLQDIVYAINDCWILPIQIVVLIYLMVTMSGVYSLSGISLFLLIIPLQTYIAKKIGQLETESAKRTDQRIAIMNEIITGIQAIKMYTWEKSFAKLVDSYRKQEIDKITALNFLKGITYSFMFYMDRATTFLCMATYVLSGHQLDAQYVYVVSLFYIHLTQSLSNSLPNVFQMMVDGRIGLKRIQNFLDQSELPEVLEERKTKGLFLENVTVKWSDDMFALQNIDFTANPSELIAVIGTVGSGKSTLLQVILKEVIIDSGRLSVGGVISYASQEPWLFSGTIRQNILFGEEMDEVRFQEVVKVCALERDFSLFPNADQTIIGERGVMLSGGQKARVNLARAIYKKADIYLLDDPLSAVDAHVGQQIFQNCIYNYLRNKCVVLVTHQLQYLNKVDRIYLMDQGKIITTGTFEEIQASETDFGSLMKDANHNEDSQKEEQVEVQEKKNDNTRNDAEFKEKKNVGKVDNSVYIDYFKSGGGLFTAFCVIFLFFLCQSGSTGADYFLSFWVNFEQQNHTNATMIESVLLDTNNFIYIYIVILILTVIIATLAIFSYVKFVMKISRNLHNSMFSKIVYATMRFFHVNPSGRILNRFSKDIGVIDGLLPDIIMDTIVVALLALSAVVINSVMNPWILIPTVILMVVFLLYRYIFLKTVRDLKRLEGTTKSPIFAHVTATTQGLTTIRAFKAQNLLKAELDNYQDLNTATHHLIFCCNRTLGFSLDFSCLVYIALVIIGFLILHSKLLVGYVGLAITQSLALTGMIQWGIRRWSDLENNMISVERIKEYADLDPESDIGKQIVPKDWPEHAMIEFRDVSMQYSPTDSLVLKNLNFTILPKEKIGIVGRTGAGKSSLITVLFRLVNFDGQIFIDNVDTKQIPLESLRSRIAIIPQDPVLFSGTLRRNLDPFDEYQDEDIWRALEDVELKNHVDSMALGLQSAISEGGANFSVGQKQLLCLARAILRSNKILILDEATANVDPQTDELIQATVRRKFSECTVLTIVHRLNTVLDSDKILVMDAGCAVEFGAPSELLEQDGIFKNLINQAQISVVK